MLLPLLSSTSFPSAVSARIADLSYPVQPSPLHSCIAGLEIVRARPSAIPKKKDGVKMLAPAKEGAELHAAAK